MKTFCKQRLDGSKYYVNRVELLKVFYRLGFDGSKHNVNSVGMAKTL